MNLALFKAMFKLQVRAVASFSLGSILYLWLEIWIYPSMSSSPAFNQLLEKLPPSLTQTFGLEGGIQKLSTFMASEFYGLLFIIILMIYCVLTATQQISRLVSNGSMAFLLSTPVSRTKVAITQSAVIIAGLVSIVVLTFLGGWYGTIWLIDGQLEFENFFQMNAMGLLLFFFISSYAFLISVMMNDEKKALGLSGGLSVIFFGFHLVSKMSDKLAALKYMTPFTTFDPTDISKGTGDLTLYAWGLFMGGLILYILAIFIFKKRDLPL